MLLKVISKLIDKQFITRAIDVGYAEIKLRLIRNSDPAKYKIRDFDVPKIQHKFKEMHINFEEYQKMKK